MILSLLKTKEIVFRRPGPKKRLHMFRSVEGIELVEQAKLLGVILQDNFSVNSHVNYMFTNPAVVYQTRDFIDHLTEIKAKTV